MHQVNLLLTSHFYSLPKATGETRRWTMGHHLIVLHVPKTNIGKHTLQHLIWRTAKLSSVLFSPTLIAFVGDFESPLIESANGNHVQKIIEVVAEYLKSKIDLPRLSVQLQMLPDAIHTVFSDTVVQVHKVTNVRTITNTLNQNDMLKKGEQARLGYLTFPVTSATAERSFSP